MVVSGSNILPHAACWHAHRSSGVGTAKASASLRGSKAFTSEEAESGRPPKVCARSDSGVASNADVDSHGVRIIESHSEAGVSGSRLPQADAASMTKKLSPTRWEEIFTVKFLTTTDKQKHTPAVHGCKASTRTPAVRKITSHRPAWHPSLMRRLLSALGWGTFPSRLRRRHHRLGRDCAKIHAHTFQTTFVTTAGLEANMLSVCLAAIATTATFGTNLHHHHHQSLRLHHHHHRQCRRRHRCHPRILTSFGRAHHHRSRHLACRPCRRRPARRLCCHRL